MIDAHAAAMRSTPQPVRPGLSLKPYPGSDGQTTWKASKGSAPYASGSLSGPMTSRSSTIDPGHPWVGTRGTAFRAWRPDVNDVDGDAVYLDAALRQGVEPRLRRPPLIRVGPVATELLEVPQRHTLRPVVHRFGLGPACRSQAGPQLVA